MLHTLISVYDLKAKVYSKPVLVPAVGAGVRSFADAVNDNSSEFSKHPEDYILYSLGTFNDVEGIFEITKPEQLALAKALVKDTV